MRLSRTAKRLAKSTVSLGKFPVSVVKTTYRSSSTARIERTSTCLRGVAP